MPQTARKTPRRVASKEERRDQLIAATIESIARHGISGTTMATVTRLAGLSVGIVNFHFDSKDRLFEETLRALAEEHRDRWQRAIADPSLSSARKIAAIVDAEFRPMRRGRKKLSAWSAFYGERTYREYYRKIVRDMDTDRWEVVRDLAQQVIDDGNYTTVSAEAFADTLDALFDGFTLSIQIYPDNTTADRAQSRVEAYLAVVFPHHFDQPKD